MCRKSRNLATRLVPGKRMLYNITTTIIIRFPIYNHSCCSVFVFHNGGELGQLLTKAKLSQNTGNDSYVLLLAAVP